MITKRDLILHGSSFCEKNISIDSNYLFLQTLWLLQPSLDL